MDSPPHSLAYPPYPPTHSHQRKAGRQGVSPELVATLLARWQKVPVARLRAGPKVSFNMQALVQELEEKTGGLAVHRAGSVVVLYRGYP